MRDPSPLAARHLFLLLRRFEQDSHFSSAESRKRSVSLPSHWLLSLLAANITMPRQAQESIQRSVRHFFQALEANPIWEEAVDEGLLSIPLLEDWETRSYQTHIVPLRTRTRHEQFLFFQLLLNGINAYPMAFPVVPKGQSRIRLVFHAHNTPDQVDKLVTVICDWAKEMLEIERGTAENALPTATRKVYATQAALQMEVQA